MNETQEPQGPRGPEGPDEKVSVSWLILQRLDDLKGQIVALETRIDDVRQDMNRRFEAMDRRLEGQARLWQWAMGIMAALVVSAIVKLFVPGA